MYFYDINYKKPKTGDIILAKLKPISSDEDSVNYYVFRVFLTKNDKYLFEEAYGIGYWTINLDEIIGWMPLKKLDELKVLTDEVS